MSEPLSGTLKQTQQDPSHGKGAVAQDRPGQPNNTADLSEQIDHRDQSASKKGQDTDFPEPGNSPEYSMQKQEQPKDQIKEDSKLHPSKDPDGNSNGNVADPSKETDGNVKDVSGDDSQKNNQNKKKDDDLAA